MQVFCIPEKTEDRKRFQLQIGAMDLGDMDKKVASAAADASPAATATSGHAVLKAFVILRPSQGQLPCLQAQMHLLAGFLLLTERF